MSGRFSRRILEYIKGRAESNRSSRGLIGTEGCRRIIEAGINGLHQGVPLKGHVSQQLSDFFRVEVKIDDPPRIERQWWPPKIVNERFQMLVNLLAKRGEAVGVEVRGRVRIP